MIELKIRTAAFTGGNSTQRVEELEWSVDRWTREMKRAIDAACGASQKHDNEHERPCDDRPSRRRARGRRFQHEVRLNGR